MEEKLWTKEEVLAENCTYGFAFDCMLQGRRITRAAWGGWWQIDKVNEIGEVIVAYIKDGKTKAPAQPYQSDQLAHDWVVLADKKEEKEIYKDDYNDSLIYFCMSNKGRELLDNFRRKFEFEVIKSSIRHDIDYTYMDLNKSIDNECCVFQEKELIKTMLSGLYASIIQQLP